MVRLSKLTDYAVVLLVQIVRREGLVSTASQLAADTGLPHPTVSKVLKILAKGGILHAQRGAMGGYLLSRPPQDINVADVITAMDGPISITDCANGKAPPCEMVRNCPVTGHWAKVNAAILGALENVTLQTMAEPQESSCARVAAKGR